LLIQDPKDFEQVLKTLHSAAEGDPVYMDINFLIFDDIGLKHVLQNSQAKACATKKTLEV